MITWQTDIEPVYYFLKNVNASRPSELPSQGEKCQNI